MTLITEAYRAANETLHATTEYGVTAPRFMGAIREIARKYACRTILDYGSGPREHVKKALMQDWELPEIGEPLRPATWFVRSYDPCVSALSADPEPADMLVSCDVLEHIEPACLADVLDHMARLTRKAAFLTIATGPAKKTLPDRRNAHLIQEGSAFWVPLLMERWRLLHFQDAGAELVCVMGAK